MPSMPRVLTSLASKASGAEIEMTPLTARDVEERKWKSRLSRLHEDVGPAPSRFSSDSEVKVRLVRKKKVSKWRIIFMVFFVISVLLNIAFITLFTYWYVKFKEIRDVWNSTFPINVSPSPAPSPRV